MEAETERGPGGRWRRLGGLRPESPLALVLVVALAALTYLLAIGWFRREIQQEALALARVQAERMAEAVSLAVGETIRDDSLALAYERMPDQTLHQLVQRHHDVVAALIVDPAGRLVAYHVEDTSTYQLGSLLLKRLGPNLRGLPEQEVIDLVRRAYGQLEPERVLIERNGQMVGWLRFFVDRSATQLAVDRAAERMLANLVSIVAALVVIVLLGTLFIRRQQRVARRLRSQRDHAEQLAYVGTLAAGLAHEIRNPINALAMQLEMLEEDIPAGGPTGARIERIRNGLGMLEHTVHDFLSYANPDRQRPARIELAELLDELRAELDRRPDAQRIRLERAVPAGLGVWCDRHALRQILSSLLGNGIKAQAGRAEPVVRVEARRQGRGQVEIRVEDGGEGIAPEVAPRIFEAFFTTRPEGTGLGLPIARRLAEMNRGRLELAAPRGALGGAAFVLTLPEEPGA